MLILSRVFREYGVEVTFDVISAEPPEGVLAKTPQAEESEKIALPRISTKKAPKVNERGEERRAYDSNGLLGIYMREAMGHGLLTEEEERDLGIRSFDHKDIEARNKLVLHCLRLVVFTVNKYRTPKLRFADAILSCNGVLMDVIGEFNPRMGRLSTFLMQSMRNEILKHVDHKGLTKKIRLRNAAEHVSIQSTEYQDVLTSTGSCDTEAVLRASESLEELSIEIRRLVSNVYQLETVRENDKTAFFEYHGLEGNPPGATLESVSRKYGVTRERIRQMVNHVWRTLARKEVRFDDRSLTRTLLLIPMLERQAGFEANLRPTLEDNAFTRYGLADEEKNLVKTMTGGRPRTEKNKKILVSIEKKCGPDLGDMVKPAQNLKSQERAGLSATEKKAGETLLEITSGMLGMSSGEALSSKHRGYATVARRAVVLILHKSHGWRIESIEELIGKKMLCLVLEKAQQEFEINESFRMFIKEIETRFATVINEAPTK